MVYILGVNTLSSICLMVKCKLSDYTVAQGKKSWKIFCLKSDCSSELCQCTDAWYMQLVAEECTLHCLEIHNKKLGPVHKQSKGSSKKPNLIFYLFFPNILCPFCSLILIGFNITSLHVIYLEYVKVTLHMKSKFKFKILFFAECLFFDSIIIANDDAFNLQWCSMLK